MYSEADLLPISALQHLAFCPRQCALIHLEQAWDENLYTVRGRLLHERVDTPGMERRRGVPTEFGLPLRSLALGLAGRADAVEFTAAGPCPVEYKLGRPKKHDADRVQLCAQALCIEEMTGRSVPVGALFYATTRRREEVPLGEALRGRVRELALALHALLDAGVTPLPEFGPHCRLCSMDNLCRARALGRGRRSVARYLARARHDEPPGDEQAGGAPPEPSPQGRARRTRPGQKPQED